ncbi:Uncharacterized conserved protein, DUF305 family [Cryobacterium psychrotolerans]|uniref:Uncharacterized conserved protein, DUF305 family n=1 Tax=Cryobacterium psychrotolerans TaxID=386301 RepID=A0A1G9DYW6_9MICO|nr:DUF305 domain-containing protein [Cryobacterium psychrotolerans]TFD83459.1 DUF305 domain-containing protein [Cryobacterium psychrotolerans]SDK69033.1 Uncharacterized conserved protein, DUF305 family [Cryobacterium psychrotolerans]
MLKTRTYILAAAALAAALTLSACTGGTAGTNGGGSSDTSNTPSASAANAADVTFAQMMIPHHEQAVEMSEDVLGKDGVDQRVVDLATQIKAAQDPEIKQMKSWLTAWGADEDMSGMDHGSTGMMSDDDMMALRDASGSEANKVFLEQMTLHHEGAIAMAQTELDAGENADAKAMAQAIVTSQSAEIQYMKELLATL